MVSRLSRSVSSLWNQMCTNLISSLSLKRNFSTRLSPDEVSVILRTNEKSQELKLGAVKCFESNNLQANFPIEDSNMVARCLFTDSILFAVCDGHGGPACAEVLAKRLLQYVSVSLLPSENIKRLKGKSSSKAVKMYCPSIVVVEELQTLHDKHFKDFVIHLLAQPPVTVATMKSVIERAFVRLDEDISREAQIRGMCLETDEDRRAFQDALAVAVSGAVAGMVHVNGVHMHVANCGDVEVVLGSRKESADRLIWSAIKLSTKHDSENQKELKRIATEHPGIERVMRGDRLLGLLQPLRAFGDVRFKWTQEDVREFVMPSMGDDARIESSVTPPYLSARPSVKYHKISAIDEFLIIGSDGLWDLMSATRAVQIVGEHLHRALSFSLRPTDENAATHLIRHALSSDLDHDHLSDLLSLPKEQVRKHRDDITVTIVFFDPDHRPSTPA